MGGEWQSPEGPGERGAAGPPGDTEGREVEGLRWGDGRSLRDVLQIGGGGLFLFDNVDAADVSKQRSEQDRCSGGAHGVAAWGESSAHV